MEKLDVVLKEKAQLLRAGDSPAGRYRGGEEINLVPAGELRMLDREFPSDYATRVSGAPKERATRAELHTLVTGFDAAKRKHARKQLMKKLASALVTVVVLAGIAAAVWHFWPQISGFVSKEASGIKKSASESSLVEENEAATQNQNP